MYPAAAIADCRSVALCADSTSTRCAARSIFTLGLSIKEIVALLALWGDRRRSSAKVKALTQKQIGELETRIAEMQAMKKALQQLAQQCNGDERPDCPILDGLAAEPNSGARCH